MALFKVGMGRDLCLPKSKVSCHNPLLQLLQEDTVIKEILKINVSEV